MVNYGVSEQGAPARGFISGLGDIARGIRQDAINLVTPDIAYPAFPLPKGAPTHRYDNMTGRIVPVEPEVTLVPTEYITEPKEAQLYQQMTQPPPPAPIPPAPTPSQMGRTPGMNPAGVSPLQRSLQGLGVSGW